MIAGSVHNRKGRKVRSMIPKNPSGSSYDPYPAKAKETVIDLPSGLRVINYT